MTIEEQSIMDALAGALEKHHAHAQESCPVTFAGPDDSPQDVPTDLGEAYQESELWDQTRDALCAYKGLKGPT